MPRKKIPELTKLKVLASQNYECNYCFEQLVSTKDRIPLYDIDHIEMHSISKNDDISNLQALCLDCHRVKTVRERRKHKNKPLGVVCDLENNRFREFQFKAS